MKTTIIIIAFAVAVIASFSFISINKKSHSIKNNNQALNTSAPMSGFILEDKQQF